MRKVKKLLSVIAFVAIITGTEFACNAATVAFGSAYVDSNTYSYVTSAVAATYSSTAKVKVSNIFKADGSTSDYKCVYCKATSTGTAVLVYTGDYYTLTIPTSNRGAGKSIGLYAMGHDPSLDCRITGIWNTY